MEERTPSPLTRKCLILPALAILALVQVGFVSDSSHEENSLSGGAK